MRLDISGPFPITSGKFHREIQKKIYWYGLSDHYSSKMILEFRYTKSELVDFVEKAYNIMKTRGTLILAIRKDNAGEKIVKTLCQEKLNIIVEHTPPNTPKLNGLVERAFAIRWERQKYQCKMQD